MSFLVLFLTVLYVLWQATPIAYAFSPEGHIAGVYYEPDLSSVSDISWERYNTAFYAFAVTTPSPEKLELVGSEDTLRHFVKETHQNNARAHLAVGGWTGSRYFSSNVAGPNNRTAFVKTVIDFALKFELDGINFDWEYPGKQGIGCNIVNSDDTENYIKFLAELRRNSSANGLIITVAAPLTTFLDDSGSPSTNMSALAEVVDLFTPMDEDVFGSWDDVVGPNAPLNDTCAPPTYQMGSAVSAVKAWVQAGIPKNKMVITYPAYGHSYSVNKSTAFIPNSKTLASYPAFNRSNQPLGDSDGNLGVDVCGNPEKPSGTFAFKSLVKRGWLGTDGEPMPGIFHRYDNCSQTPYVYNETTEVMISYQDEASYRSIGNFIKSEGLKGFSMWVQGNDYKDKLAEAIDDAIGFDTTQTKRNWVY